MHNIEEFRDYCMSKPGVEEGFPFDDNTLVFKVMNKLFALTGLNGDDFKVNLKCDPDKAIQLRSEFPDVIPGFHMNKKHWNTVFFDRELDSKMLMDLVNHSYDLVVKKLTLKDREILRQLNS